MAKWISCGMCSGTGKVAVVRKGQDPIIRNCHLCGGKGKIKVG